MGDASSSARTQIRVFSFQGSWHFCRIPDTSWEQFLARSNWAHGTGGIILTGDCAMRERNLPERNAFSEWTITADDAESRVARAIRICVGNHLQRTYSDLLKAPIPPKIAALLRRLDH
jgi:hypothetical protein